MRACILSTLISVMVPGWALSEVNRSWEELMQTVKPGQTIVVTRMNSANLTGQLVQITSEAATIKWQGGTKEVPRAEVYRVKTESRRARRATIGAIAAGGSCLAVLGTIDAKVFKDPGEPVAWGPVLAFSSMCAGAGAGIGAAMPGQKTLYEATHPGGQPAIRTRQGDSVTP